jgi:hypothetical protein
VICSIEAGLAEAKVIKRGHGARPDLRRKPVQCIGVSAELAALMDRDPHHVAPV